MKNKEVTNWAQKMLSANVVFFDTETTGLSNDDEIVEIAIVDKTGKILLNSLVKPKQKIPTSAQKIHGITNNNVKNAPSWDELHIQVMDIFSNAEYVIAYNMVYDWRMLLQTVQGYDLEKNYQSLGKIEKKLHCAMHRFASFYGEWNEYFGDWTWQKLSTAAKYFDIEQKNAHRALDDTVTTLRLVEKLATFCPDRA
jgi:DNA polymerase III subunit epsilon